MKVVLASSFVPFVYGGGRFIVEWLENALIKRGHSVEIFYLPCQETTPDILDQMLAYRLMDFTKSADRLITFRPPAHCLRHPKKTCWFIHHFRGFYDLEGTPYQSYSDDASGRALRDAIRSHDTVALTEAQRVFSNSNVVRNRLQSFNGVAAETLYPPLDEDALFHHSEYGDEIVSVCRLEEHKRQHLLIEAMAHTRSEVRLRLCGRSASPVYENRLRTMVTRLGLQDRVALEFDWISEDRKAILLSGALASVYAPLDEDSYGYPTLEAAAARKATITTTDSGGVVEFIRDGENGLICEPDPNHLAACFDRLWTDRSDAASLGASAAATPAELGITWSHVIERLLAD